MTLSIAALLDAFEVAEADREQYLEAAADPLRLPPDTQAWLALVPVWTPGLARVCGFPVPSGLWSAPEEDFAHAVGDFRGPTYVSPQKGDSDAPATVTVPRAGSSASRDRPDRGPEWEFFERAVRAGVCESSPGRGREEEPLFWLAAGGRAEAVEQLPLRSVMGLERLQAHLARIAHALEGIPHTRLPALLRPWRALALQAADTDGLMQVAAALRAAVLPEGASPAGLDAQEASRLATEGREWVEAARPLARLFGGALQAEVEAASRRLELFARHEDDRRRLVHFLRRDEQLRAFDELLADGGGAWALHYCGAGGLGKTMLLRYLNVREGATRGLATTRIDFDLLHPDYPSRAPALLLVQLAVELRRLELADHVQSRFQSFDFKVQGLHERLSGNRPGPLDLRKDAEFSGVVSVFAESLESLGRPVVLFLDTCEELVKLRADVKPPDTVPATFTILEMLHERLAALRVVLSGRRPLGSEGAGGWRARKGEGLVKRSYLRLHEVLGFTAEEAQRYLTRRQWAQMPTQVLRDAVVAASQIRRRPPEDSPQGRELTERFDYPSGSAPKNVLRYNPYELNRLADWVQLNPHMTPETVAKADPDEYVQLRILGHILQPTLREAMAAVALAGTLDREMFAAVAGIGDADAAFQELRAVDWTDFKAGFVEVEPWLLPLLRRYYETKQRPALAWARRTLADHLERFILDEKNWDRLDARHFDVALRTLEQVDPARAAHWWNQVELLAARRGTFDRMRGWLDYLLGDDGPARPTTPESPTTSRLRPALLAARAAALYQLGSNQAAAAWDQVALEWKTDPDTAAGERLRRRAVAGRVSVMRLPEVLYRRRYVALWFEELENLSDAVFQDRGLIAAFLAAAESFVELAERRTGPDADALGQGASALVNLARHLLAENVGLSVFALALAGRAANAADPESPEGLRHLERAVGMIGPSPHSHDPVGIDWAAPEAWPERVCLDYLRVAHPRWLPLLEALHPVAAYLRDAYPPHLPRAEALLGGPDPLRGLWIPLLSPNSTDCNRLSGALYQLIERIGLCRCWDAHGPRKPAPDAHLDRRLCFAHEMVPPQWVAEQVARVLAGDVDAPLHTLREESSQSVSSARELNRTLELGNAIHHIRRRMRLLGSTPFSQQVGGLGTRAEAGLMRATTILGPPREDGPALPHEPELASFPWRQRVHALWQGLFVAHSRAARSAVQWVRARQSEPEAAAPAISSEEQFDKFAWLLDRWEALLVARRFREKTGQKALGVSQQQLAEVWAWVVRCPRPDLALVLWLRLDAVESSLSAPLLAAPHPLVAHVGTRWAGEMALRYGEILALRLPEHGARLLAQAREWFLVAGDPVGALLAHTARVLCWPRHQPRRRRPLGPSPSFLESERNALGARYEAVRGSLVGELPSWETLEGVADAPTRGRLEGLGPEGWRPWLVRIVAFLAWQRDGDLAGSACAALVDVLPQLDNFAQGVPAELFGWLTTGPAVADPPASLYPPTILIDTPDESPVRNTSLPETFPAALLPQTIEGPPPLQGWGHPTNPYSSAWQDTPEDNLGPAWLRQACGESEVVQLRLSPGVAAALPWESLLHRAWDPDEDPPTFLRSVGKARVPTRRFEWQNVLVVAEGSEYVPFGEELWREVAPRIEFATALPLLSGLANADGPRVLHLVGVPVPTATGVLWRVGNAPASTIKQSRGYVLDAVALIQHVRNVRCCVLQLPPSPVYRRRGRTEREQAGFQRIFAAEVAAAGVPLVFTVPPLPLDSLARLLPPWALALTYVARGNSLLLPPQIAQVHDRFSLVFPDRDDNLLELLDDFCVHATLPLKRGPP